MNNESRIINESHAQLLKRFQAEESREIESVVTVVLFKSTNDQRTYHIAQVVADDAQDSRDELFCESAARLEMEVREVVAGYGRVKS